MRRPRKPSREGVQSREAAHLVQQYLSASPRSPNDMLSGGGALRRGARRGLPGGEALQQQASTPVRGPGYNVLGICIPSPAPEALGRAHHTRC